MSTTTTPSGTNISILQSTHMTATVQTTSGSHYTVVTRPSVGVVLIHDDKGWVIRAGKGSRVSVVQGRLFVMGADGKVFARTTAITSIYIMSN